MSNYNEQLRIAKLESARSEVNSALINQAIKDGRSLEELINSIIKDRDAIFSKTDPNMTKSIDLYCENSNSTQVMSFSESERVARLESIRDGESTMLIDAAIQNGQTAEQVAHSIMKERAVAKGADVDSEIVNMIVAGVNANRQQLSQDQDVVQSPQSAGDQSLTDIIVASANQNRTHSRRE